jgi:hypothetical protein
MKGILQRLIRIARSYGPHMPSPLVKERWKRRLVNYREDYSGWHEDSYTDTSAGNKQSSDKSQEARRGAFSDDTREKFSIAIPSQVVEDLAVFGLTPPSSWEEIRSARNREIKKYHSDKFIHDAEKFETSKEIMQIYNAAFDRLSKYYNNK